MATPVLLFGYDSSPFTQKIRLALRLKQVQYAFVAVPSMMPRPILHENFHLFYRKIPVCVIGRELYCDTAIILEALEFFFPPAQGYGTIYPKTSDGCNHRSLMRGFASYWTDRPLFRVTTGLIPAAVWRTSFGRDRAGLIGHQLDADKLEAKVPQNLSNLDLHLSILESQFAESGSTWIWPTDKPSLADIALFYQLSWGMDISAGKGIYNLTAGGTEDTSGEGAQTVFNADRYPGLWKWFNAFKNHIDALPSVEMHGAVDDALQSIRSYRAETSVTDALIPTPAPPHDDLDRRNGLLPGVSVSVAPDDTGRGDPTFGELLAVTPEEIVIRPQKRNGKEAPIQTRIHFPRLGFVVRPVVDVKL